MVAVLEEESAAQKIHVEKVKNHFKLQASSWLKDFPEDERNDIVARFLQECL